MGNCLGIDHGCGVSSLCLHLADIRVRPGQWIRRGEVLGHVGTSGLSTGPHVHWGLFVGGRPVDPAQWLEPDIFRAFIR